MGVSISGAGVCETSARVEAIAGRRHNLRAETEIDIPIESAARALLDRIIAGCTRRMF
jgi:hypothetical protein